jgi:hypothetical protein
MEVGPLPFKVFSLGYIPREGAYIVLPSEANVGGLDLRGDFPAVFCYMLRLKRRDVVVLKLLEVSFKNGAYAS